MGDGPDDTTNFSLLRRGKRKDYFTGALPWPQKGTAVTLPLGTQAPIISGNFNTIASSLPAPTGASSSYVPASVAGVGYNWANNASGTGIYASATINQLRQSFQIQRLLERDARGGTRYTEIVRSHFGVVSPDSRLQRPEYIGGGSTPININPIAQTSGSGASGTTTP